MNNRKPPTQHDMKPLWIQSSFCFWTFQKHWTSCKVLLLIRLLVQVTQKWRSYYWSRSRPSSAAWFSSKCSRNITRNPKPHTHHTNIWTPVFRAQTVQDWPLSSFHHVGRALDTDTRSDHMTTQTSTSQETALVYRRPSESVQVPLRSEPVDLMLEHVRISSGPASTMTTC